MSTQTITVPDMGSDDPAEVVEVHVSEGDQIEVEQSLIVLESDKASVEVPSTHAGKITKLLVKEGDQIKTGAPIAELETDSAAEEGESEQEAGREKGDTAEEKDAEEGAGKQADDTEKPAKQDKPAAAAEPKTTTSTQTVPIPDLGGADEVEVIELSVQPGDDVAEGDSLIVLESDKASLEVPSPASGKVVEFLLKEGDKVKEGQDILTLEVSSSADSQSETKSDTKEPIKSEPETTKERSKPASGSQPVTKQATVNQLDTSVSATAQGDDRIYAGPSVRKLARQLGVDLAKVKPTGPRDRCTKDDVRGYVRDIIEGKGGNAIPAIPSVDFSQFGPVKREKLSKIKRATATNMHRSWLNVPHVTQFDEADITELEDYRKAQKAEAEKRGVKLSPVPFLIKACAMALREEPNFNVSLDPDGEHVFQKDYVHIGMAVDTPKGLMVPVVRDADKKDVWEIAEAVGDLAGKARDGKLAPKEMKGGCFSISSLGAIGGQGFTPIVNTPEVGILGISKATIKPWWDGDAFVARNFLPLSLSYDHRAVDGADAGRFLTYLVSVLSDHEKLLG